MKSLAFDGDFEITSPYGWRTDPITGQKTFHNGIDVGTPMRTPLYARDDGDIRISTKDSYGGLYIQIRRSDGSGYYYLHLDESIVKVGQHVVQGQLLGYSGNSGNSTGPHTHFGLQSDATVWGSCIDPTAFFSEETIDSPRFKKGDVLVFTDIQNIRKGSGTSYEIIRQSTSGEIFTVVDNPRQADGYNWFDTGNGWVADVNKFELYASPIVTPPVDPQIKELENQVTNLQTQNDELSGELKLVHEQIVSLVANAEQSEKDYQELSDKYGTLAIEKKTAINDKEEAIKLLMALKSSRFFWVLEMLEKLFPKKN